MQGLSRRECLSKLRAPVDDAPLPDPAVQYLIHWFVESGMMMQGGMAPAPLTWQELESFERGTAYRMTPWERGQIIAMSRAYTGGLSELKDHKAPAPYQSEATKAEQARRQAEVDAMKRKKKRDK